MNAAKKYVDDFYSRYDGRVAVTVGVTKGFGMVYPLVFESPKGIPIGIVGMAWNEGQSDNLVQIYHISSFKNTLGHGTKIMKELCREADNQQVDLYLQAEPQSNGTDEIGISKLIAWYRKFGFDGKGCMQRNFKGGT